MAVDIDLSSLEKMASFVTFPDGVETHDAGRRRLRDMAPPSFDLILALDVLEHVDDLSTTLSDLCTMLVPGGMIVISGPTENALYKLGRWIAGAVYSGDYHERGIDEIRDTLANYTEVSTVATLFRVITRSCGLPRQQRRRILGVSHIPSAAIGAAERIRHAQGYHEWRPRAESRDHAVAG